MTRYILPESDDKLLAECDIETYRSGGKGGQHANSTDSAVRLTHRASGVVATCQTERSQHQNKARALEELRRRIEKLNHRRKKRVPTAVPNGVRRARLLAKKKRAERKSFRAKPGMD